MLEYVPDLNRIIYLIKNYPAWTHSLVMSLYYWKQDDLLFEIFEKSYEDDDFDVRGVFLHMFYPLRKEVGIYFANNTHLLKYDWYYFHRIDINDFLINNYSDNLLIGALYFALSDFQDFETQEDIDKNTEFHNILVDLLITKDYPLKYLPEVFEYYELLKKNHNKLYIKLEDFFENMEELKQFLNVVMSVNQEDLIPLAKFYNLI